MTQGRCIPTDSMKSEDDCSNLGHNSRIMDYIESDKNNLIYLISSYYSMPGCIHLSQKRLGEI